MTAIKSRAALSCSLTLTALTSLLMSLFMSLFGSRMVLAQAVRKPCELAQAVTAGQSWMSFDSESLPAPVLAVSVPASGWLVVRAAVVNDGYAGGAWFETLAIDCVDGEAITAEAGQFMNHGMVHVLSSGTVYLRVGAVDRSATQETGRLHLTTKFLHSLAPWRVTKDGGPGDDTEVEDGEILPRLVPDPTVPGVDPAPAPTLSVGPLFFTKDGGPGDDTEVEDGEILPRPVPDPTVPGVTPAPITTLSTDPLSFVKDGGPGDDTEVEDGEILPATSSLNAAEGLPCGPREPANDFAFCATELAVGRGILGSLESAVGFDQDYFSFRVQGLRGVHITVESQSDIRVTLTDRWGKRLLRGRADARRESVELDAVLVAGRYYLRVEGRAAGDGRYRARLRLGENSY